MRDKRSSVESVQSVHVVDASKLCSGLCGLSTYGQIAL